MSNKDSRWFWKMGRVFQISRTKPTSNASHISPAWLNETAYNELKQLVLLLTIKEMKDMKDMFYACESLVIFHVMSILNLHRSIDTYSGWATLKPNLPDPANHAVIYTSEKPPRPFQLTDEDGAVITEILYKDPIRVQSERSDTEATLAKTSRINYSKIYKVAKDLRVLNIGMVHQNSMAGFILDSPIKPLKRRAGR